MQEMVKQSIFLAMFGALLIYVLKQQEKRDVASELREQKYQEIITNLTNSLNIVDKVSADVEDIKKFIFANKNCRVGEVDR